MQSALWKIAALVSVIGIGGFVVVTVHDQLQLQTAGTNDPNRFDPVNGDDGSNGSPESTPTLGPASDAMTAGGFDFPPDDQSEPGSDGNAGRFVSAETPTAQPTLATPGDESGDSSNPFLTAGPPASEFESTNVGPADFENSTFDPFAAADSFAVDRASGFETASPSTELTTADARLGADPREGVEQVAAARAPAEPGSFNPFAGPGLEADREPTASGDANSDRFGALILPEEPGRLDATEDATPPEPTAGLPELTFDQTEPDPANDPFGGAGAAESFGPEPATENAGADPFSSGFDPQLENDTGATFDFGELATPEPELALPQDEPATTELPSPALQPEPAVELFSSSDVEPVPASTGEPSRFPTAANESDLPKTAVRPRELHPLTPQPVNPLPEVRPINPDVVPDASGGPRPEFVGDGTLGGMTTSGPQQPELTIQKLAPPDATVGDPLVYAIKVKNVGNSTARDVIVEDKIPRGTTLEGSIPQAELIDKKLIWQLGHMEPGDEKTIRIKVVPTEAGDVGSVATVRFVAEVAATTRITTPSLTMDVEGPGEVAIGEQVVFRFRITNIGDGEARNVYVRNLLPAGFEHPGGNDIEYDVGSLKPGETRAVDLAVTAAQEGQHALRAQLNTGATVRDESETPVSVIKSRLLIQRQGPKRRFVGRPADYTTIVSNRSSRPLQRVEVVEKLPAGMELAAAPDGGHYDPQRRTITWRISELAAGGGATLKTSVIASQQGVLLGSVTVIDAAGNQAQLKSQLEVAGFASLKVDWEHDGRPVGVGDSVAMQLTVKNRGTGAAEQVEALFDIPDHLTFVNAEGPVQFEQQGRTVRFAALDQLEANEEQTFKIMLTAAAPGNTPVTAQLTTAALEGPLQHAEAVIVEADGQ